MQDQVFRVEYFAITADDRPGIGADLARRLTVIQTDVPSALAAPETNRRTVDAASLNRLFDQLQFGNMLRQRCLRV